MAPENDEQNIYISYEQTNYEGAESEICNDYNKLVNEICVDKKDYAKKGRHKKQNRNKN